MLIIILKPKDYNMVAKVITKSPLKTKVITSKGLFMIPLQGYSENEFLKLALLLKHLIDYDYIEKYMIQYQPTNYFSRELKHILETFIKKNILHIPINILYLHNAPVCFQTIKFNIPQVDEETMVTCKNLAILSAKYPNKTTHTMCISRTRRYLYPTPPSIPILLTSMRSKFNYELKHIQPNPIELAIRLEANGETIINEIISREKIIQKTINSEGELINTQPITIKSNYTETLTPKNFKHYKEIQKFIILNDIYKITGATETMVNCEDLLNYIQNPYKIINTFKKIQVKYYTLEDDTLLIDSISLLDSNRNLYIMANTHNLTRNKDILILKNNGLTYKFKTHKDYYEFITRNFQKLVARRNKEFLLF